MGRTAYLGWFSPETEADRNIAVWAMQRTDTLQFADRRIGQLSGGEQQRVLIARALAQSAPTLLMDEPTAHLDLRHQVEILALAARLAHDSGLAVLIALHDLNLAAQFADWIVLLAEGRMQAAGKPADVLRPECLTEVFGLPIQVIRDPAPGVPLMLVSTSAAAIRSADASESGRSSPAASI